MEIVFHVEGGSSRGQSSDMRKAFHDFFSKLHDLANAGNSKISPVKMHGSRSSAYKGFCHALENEPEKYHVLLVDSEGPVKHWGKCWQHLREREGKNWARPKGVEEEQCQLMVEAIESWLFADPEKLRRFYDPGFGNIPIREKVEQIPKSDHVASLNAAAKHTAKGRYKKIEHLADLLGKLDTAKVRQRAWHCDRIFVTLSAKLGDALPPLCPLAQEPG